MPRRWTSGDDLRELDVGLGVAFTPKVQFEYLAGGFIDAELRLGAMSRRQSSARRRARIPADRVLIVGAIIAVRSTVSRSTKSASAMWPDGLVLQCSREAKHHALVGGDREMIRPMHQALGGMRRERTLRTRQYPAR